MSNRTPSHDGDKPIDANLIPERPAPASPPIADTPSQASASGTPSASAPLPPPCPSDPDTQARIRSRLGRSDCGLNGLAMVLDVSAESLSPVLGEMIRADEVEIVHSAGIERYHLV